MFLFVVANVPIEMIISRIIYEIVFQISIRKTSFLVYSEELNEYVLLKIYIEKKKKILKFICSIVVFEEVMLNFFSKN